MKSPLKYYGGKSKLALPIVGVMPKHDTYVELFGGSGAVLFAKPPARVEVYNDLDEDLVTFFRVLRDPELAKRLRTQLEMTPYARTEHACCRRLRTDDAVERARCLYVRVRQSINGIVDGSWRYSRQPGSIEPFYSSLQVLAAAAQRLRSIYIENRDAMELIDIWDSGEVLFYADPPYISACRIAPQVYGHELDEGQHRGLLARLNNCRGTVLLSGYDHPLYASMLAGWSRVELPTRCWSTPAYDANGERRAKADRVEVLWLNPKAAQRLAEASHPMAGRLRLVQRAVAAEAIPHVATMNLPAASEPCSPIRSAANRFNGLFSSERDNWATPTPLFESLNREFGFDIDVCATEVNTKCSRFFSPQVDGLRQDWGVRTCWMNPPYGKEISLWMEKAYKSSLFGATVVCLVPSRTDTQWWQRWAQRGAVRLLPGRVRFVHPDGNAGATAPFPSAVVIFRGRRPEVDLFESHDVTARRIWGSSAARLAPWLLHRARAVVCTAREDANA